MNLDQLWNNGLKLNNLVFFNELFDDLFDFNDSWDFNNGLNNFFNDLLDRDLLNDSFLDWDNLFLDDFDLFNSFLNY